MCEEHNIPKVYDPASVEKKWYKFWEEHRYFHAEVEEGKEAFSIVIPHRTSPVSCIWAMHWIIPCRIS